MTPQQAMNAARNIARRCAINSHRNLFGPLIVEYGWTWIGPRGQTRAVSSGRDEEPSGLVASRCADERAQAAPWGRLL